MDASRGFFGKLRSLALTLEKEAKQLERALRGEDADYEEESPMRVLHDLHCEIRALKEDANGALGKSSSERQEINDFMKASEILMQRNAADLAKIRELFQKYGYKPLVKVPTEEQEEEANGDSKASDQSKSDQEEADDVPPLPACAENPPVPRDPLRNPQLSDFGLSQYAFSRPWSALHGQQRAANASQENAKHKTPQKTQAPCVLPKTPKCMLKMDDFECVTPKLEHFGISEHTMCMNEDYTMALIHKTAQSNNLVKKGDDEVNVAKMPSREIAVTPEPKTKATDENSADCMASPMIPVFCTPGVKIPSRADSTELAKSPERDKLPLPSHAATPPPPDFEARWLKRELMEMQEKIMLVTENSATEQQNIEDSVPSAVSSDEYLKRLGNPSPPKIKQYDHLLSTPPPPEITRIPDDVLQILSKYNHNVDSSISKKMETKAGDAARFGSDFSDYCNKENRGYPDFFKSDI
ncbi:spindle and kinetochore-associated protein 3 isoform X1 [Phasianus colchicus]|uniref:Spindle and kinetochore associated complex subunit 3 n=2 Tax=Phasianus colchicus TaxID=9054 RepID=A0A669QWV7_PHACC|nr:spindle and kinetochore-associated protein 3 isoform X1 [Phasianus colchicus]